MRIFVLLQARMGSSRLPNKIMLPLCDKMVIEHDIERICRSKKINDLIICTTTEERDKCIVELCEKKGIKYFCGSELNVLDRYYKACLLYKPDIIMRITSDCPMIDHEIIDNMIDNYLLIMDKSPYYCPEYADPSRSHNFPDGFNPEIFTFDILKEAWENATDNYDKEHVGPYMKRKYCKFFYKFVLRREYKNLDFTTLHLSLDTYDDYKLLTEIFENVYLKNKYFSIDDVLEYLDIKKDEK